MLSALPLADPPFTEPYGDDWPGNLLLPAIILAVCVGLLLLSAARRLNAGGSAGWLFFWAACLAVLMMICLWIFLSWIAQIWIFWVVIICLLVLAFWAVLRRRA